MSATRLVLDTSVALYLLRAGAPKGQEAKHREARAVLDLPEKEWILCLPTPALGEVLAGVPADKRDVALGQLSKMFEILVLDLEAARVVADLVGPALRAPRTTPKQQVKVDVEIVACALRWQADGLCAFDGDHAKIVARSDRKLTVGPPTRFLPRQEDIPFDPQDAEDE